MRFGSQAGQVITLRNSAGTGSIGYGFAVNELAGGKILVLSGNDVGQARSITANNADNGTAGTITYSGTQLAGIQQNDWFVVLPPGTSFRWIRNFFHQTTGGQPDIDNFTQYGDWVKWAADRPNDFKAIDPLASIILEASRGIYFPGELPPEPYISGYGYPPGLR
jgi:hypothetical protein